MGYRCFVEEYPVKDYADFYLTHFLHDQVIPPREWRPRRDPLTENIEVLDRIKLKTVVRQHVEFDPEELSPHVFHLTNVKRRPMTLGRFRDLAKAR